MQGEPGDDQGNGTEGATGMRDLVRGHDWAASPLGPREGWPRSLQTVVALILDAPQPMCLYWGPELAWICNDGYAALMRESPPRDLGRPGRDRWPDLWGCGAEAYEAVLAGASRTVRDRSPTLAGSAAERWYDVSYSPLRDDGDEIAGILVTATETTSQVLARRRPADAGPALRERMGVQTFLHDLDAALRPLDDPEEIKGTATRFLGERLGVSRALYTEIIDETWADISGDYVDGIPSMERRIRIVEFGSLLSGLFRRGETLVFGDVMTDTRLSPSQREALVGIGARASLSVGLVREGRWIAAFGVHSETPREWTETEIFLVRETANRIWAPLERTRIDAARRESDRHFQALVHATSEIVYRMSADWTEMHELKGRGFLADTPSSDSGWTERYILADDRAMVWEAIEAARAARSTFELEHRVARADGSIGWVHSRAIPILGDDGEVLEWFGAATDVTERLHIQEGLRKFSRVIEQTASLVLITDTEGNIEYVNPRFTEATGYRADEALGRRPSLLKSGLTPPECYRDLWATITGGGTWQGEFRNRRKDGSLYWESAIISPIRDREGRITHFAGIKEDITQRKQDEAVLARSRRLEAVGQLAGSVSHDFNNLLSVIVANLELLAPRLQSTETRRLIRRALEAAETGVSFNKRLLSLARQRDLSPEPLAINLRVEDWAPLLRHVLGHSIDLVMELSPEVSLVAADRTEIDSAILNLATNARDAMPKGGELVIRTEIAAPDAAELTDAPGAAAGPFVRLSFTDNGQGMSEETRARAREPFFTTKGADRGTGLGLSSVERFAVQSGGLLQIRSRPDDGTTVSVLLPVAQGTGRRPRRTEADDLPLGRGELILLVEDIDAVREVTRERLDALGYDVIEAATGGEAIEILQEEETIACVFSDIVMPDGVSGHDLLDWVVAHRPGIGMLLTTAYDSKSARRRHDGPVRVRVLPKPHGLRDLARVLRETLDETETP